MATMPTPGNTTPIQTPQEQADNATRKYMSDLIPVLLAYAVASLIVK